MESKVKVKVNFDVSNKFKFEFNSKAFIVIVQNTTRCIVTAPESALQTDILNTDEKA